jgi:hypothetical protein
MEPYIISASRREDIPAFRSEWLLERVRAGFVNMSAPRADYIISFARAKLFVFWSKNPQPLIQYLDDFPYPCYFQFTLNDYPEFEHNMPLLEDRIDTFAGLSKKIGKERVIWRFDPFIVTDDITPKEVLSRVYEIGSRLRWLTEKLVFSFIDPYKKLGNAFHEVSDADKQYIVDGLKEMNKDWRLTLATCAEGFEAEGVEHNKCIDPELVTRICGEQSWIKPAKDPSQRPLCGCMVSGDIGTFGACRHRCDYCYAK